MNDLEFSMLSALVNNIPEYYANLALPDPVLVEHYTSEQNRVYWLDTQIDDSTLALVAFNNKPHQSKC